MTRTHCYAQNTAADSLWRTIEVDEDGCTRCQARARKVAKAMRWNTLVANTGFLCVTRNPRGRFSSSYLGDKLGVLGVCLCMDALAFKCVIGKGIVVLFGAVGTVE